MLSDIGRLSVNFFQLPMGPSSFYIGCGVVELAMRYSTTSNTPRMPGWIRQKKVKVPVVSGVNSMY
jgi:hypothetical protein